MEKKGFKEKLRDFALSNGILFAIIVLIIVTGILEPNFLKWSNLLNILRQISVNGIVACGMTVCIMSGCYDLSVGSIVSLTGVFTILSINAGINDFVCILFGLCIGLAAGIANGALIASINGRSGEAFIITYGMQVVLAAIALFPSKGLFISGKVYPGPQQDPVRPGSVLHRQQPGCRPHERSSDQALPDQLLRHIRIPGRSGRCGALFPRYIIQPHGRPEL